MENTSWIKVNDLRYESFTGLLVDSPEDDLIKLRENQIERIEYGIGKTLDACSTVIYYCKLTTDRNQFLFFNNGDEGAYTLDRIDDILSNDIYGFEWCERTGA